MVIKKNFPIGKRVKKTRAFPSCWLMKWVPALVDVQSAELTTDIHSRHQIGLG